MTDGLISVIVPVYNVERYLGACLDSILSQSYREIEVILINDGSDDLSGKIAETYAEEDQRITLYNFENEGLGEARNHGLSVATGEYVTFVDSDDILLPGALEVLLKVMDSTGADIVEGGMKHGIDLGKYQIKKHVMRVYTHEEAIGEMLYQKGLNTSVCGKLYKKFLFDDLRFEKGILYEDLNIMYLLFDHSNKVAYTNYPIYFYRDRDGSIVNSWDNKRLDVLKVTENLENYISENYPGLLPAARDRRLSANFNMFALCTLSGDKETALKCWEKVKNYRRESLFNPYVRIKNKGGILLSYLGHHIFKIFVRRVYS